MFRFSVRIFFTALILFLPVKVFSAWPPMPTGNYYLKTIVRDSNAQGLHMKFLYQHISESYTYSYYVYANGYLGYNSTDPAYSQHNSQDRATIDFALVGTLTAYSQGAISCYNTWKDKYLALGTLRGINFTITVINNGTELACAAYYLDGVLLKQVCEAPTSGLTGNYQTAGVDWSTNHIFQIRNASGELLTESYIFSGWESSDFYTLIVDITGSPFTEEFDGWIPLDNDGRTFPDNENIPFTEDPQVPEFDQDTYIINNTYSYDNSYTDSSQNQTINQVGSNVPNVDADNYYDQFRKALHDEGMMYENSNDTFGEFDNDLTDDRGFFALAGDTHQKVKDTASGLKSVVDDMAGKIESIEPLKFPSAIGTTTHFTIGNPFPEFISEATEYSFDLRPMASTILSIRKFLLLCLSVIFWISAVQIIRGGIS